MKLRVTTAMLLALAATACNSAPAANNAAAPVAPAQSNTVVATPAVNNNAATTPTGETPAKAAAAEGCAGEIGQRAADQLVLQCRDVSPATRPPCNVANSCEMIRDEIARGCGMLGADAPEYCPPGG